MSEWLVSVVFSNGEKAAWRCETYDTYDWGMILRGAVVVVNGARSSASQVRLPYANVNYISTERVNR